MDWLVNQKIPIGDSVQAVRETVLYVLATSPVDIAGGLERAVDWVLWCLQIPHPLIVVAVFVAFSYGMQRSFVITGFVLLGFLGILNQGYWEETLRTLIMIAMTVFICMIVGVPLGIATAHRRWLYVLLRPILHLMQVVPVLLYLLPAVLVFELGTGAGLIAAILFVIPVPIQVVYLAVMATPTQLLETADAFGATASQRFRKIELPHARPGLMAALSRTVKLSLIIVLLAGLVGADGLGATFIGALQPFDTVRSVESGLVIFLLAVMLDRIFRMKG